MYSCHLWLISSASVMSVLFLLFIVPIFELNTPLIALIFLKNYLVFPILLFSSISLHCSLRKTFLSLFAILWNFAFRWVYFYFSSLPFTSLFSQLFVRPPETAIWPFWISFSWGCFNINYSNSWTWKSSHLFVSSFFVIIVSQLSVYRYIASLVKFIPAHITLLLIL